ncbi:hypothetical protein GCM10023086_65960 [Streptomyces venetus]|uniref:Uncharacterized protein n=1 Tax=Streptomyces venetus TaxID=1701086 RepID=A0ABP8H4F0_9ACTN
MGIRTLLRRTATGVAPPQVPPFAVAASTVRVPATFTPALRRATEDLRRHLAPTRGPVGITGADTPTAPGPGMPAHLGDTEAVPGNARASLSRPRPWAGLARGCLTLVLALSPRSRPAFVTTATGPLSGRPDGSAPRRRRGRDRPGPGPDGAP